MNQINEQKSNNDDNIRQNQVDEDRIESNEDSPLETSISDSDIKQEIHGKDNVQLNNSIVQNFYDGFSKKDYEQYANETSFSIERYRFSDEELDKISKIFVKSKKFEELVTVSKKQIVFITGEKGVGKFTAALYFGNLLKSESKIKNIYIISDAEKIAVSTLLNKLPSKSFLLIENTFEYDVFSLSKKIFGNVDCARLTYIKNSLKDSYIATVSNNNLDFFSAKSKEDLFNECIVIEDYERPDPIKILEKHVDFYLNTKQKLKFNEILKYEEIRTLLIRLDSPQKIAKLVEYSLTNLDIESNLEYLKHFIIKEVDNLLNIKSEVQSYFEELTDEGKTLSIALSLFSGISESELWLINKDLNFAITNKKEIENQDVNEKSIFSRSKHDLLKEIRANVDYSFIESVIGISKITKVQFDDENYPSEIINYVKSNYPEAMQKIVIPLKTQLGNSINDQQSRIRIANSLGKLASTNWLTIKQLVEQYSMEDHPALRAISGHILETAIQDELINDEVGKLLSKWSSLPISEDNWKIIWTVCSSYKQIGQFNIKFAMHGLKQIISNFKSNPQEFVAGARVFDSVKYTLIVLALLGNLSQIIEDIRIWISDSNKEKDYLLKLIISLIWMDIAAVFAGLKQKTDSQNEILLSVSNNEKTINALSELNSLFFVTLHDFTINGRPMSTIFFEIAEDWLVSTDSRVLNNVAVDIIKRTRKNLKNHHHKYEKYFIAYIKKFWLFHKRHNSIKKAAKIILK